MLYTVRFDHVYCDDGIPESTYTRFNTREAAEAYLATFEEYEDVTLEVTPTFNSVKDTLPF